MVSFMGMMLSSYVKKDENLLFFLGLLLRLLIFLFRLSSQSSQA
jgi:hypothetical protein